MAYANRTSISSGPGSGIVRSRAPKRLTITLPFTVFSALEQRSGQEGRSLSNLAAYLIERGLNQPLPPDAATA
ncbi:MAG: ribbon-helix-helix domain-containing protein [Prochlorococcaceae cyanobacterium]